MKLRIVIIAALGLALGLYLLMYVGLGAVFSAAVAVGWSGFAILCLYALGLSLSLEPLGTFCCPTVPGGTAGFRSGADGSGFGRGSAAVSQLGGLVLGARAAILQGVSSSLALASTIVDVTTEMLAQIAYIALGVLIFSARAPRTSFELSLMTVFVIGLVLAAVAGGLFLALQRYGQGVTRRLAARLFAGAAAATATVAAGLDAIYRSRVRVGLSLAIHLGGWITSAIGTWIAFRLIGARADLAAVIAIESLVCATRSAAFLIPNALGVQEAAYAVLAPLFGVGAEFGLAVSLLKRARDIAVGVPILLIWQAMEGQRALAGRPSGNH